MQVYDTKTKVEGDFSSALQKCVGIQMDTIDLKTLLNLSDEDLKKTTLQTIEGVNVLSATLDWEEKELSDVLVSYFIDSDRQLIGMMIEAKRNTTYADKETNITFQWELSFTKPEKEIEIVAPTDLDSYVLQEDKS